MRFFGFQTHDSRAWTHLSKSSGAEQDPCISTISGYGVLLEQKRGKAPKGLPFELGQPNLS